MRDTSGFLVISGASHARGPRRGRVALLLCGLVLAGSTSGGTIYRCQSADGAIEMRQTPCPANAQGGEIQVEDRTTGWTPPTEDLTPPTGAKPSKSKADPAEKAQAAAEKKREKCWKKQQQLENVESKLRAGYSPNSGEKLRRQQKEYQEYLYEFCP